MRSNVLVSFSMCLLVVGVNSGTIAHAEPTVIRATLGEASVERENGPVKKCEIFIALVNIPETVAFRVKVLEMDGVFMRSFTVDAMQFKRVSNGIPYDLEKKPITSARVISNTFDSDKVSSRVDMGDGGIGYKLNTDESFFSLLKLIGRGDYYVTFKRRDRNDFTTFVVGEKVGPNIIKELAACMGAM